MTDHPQAAATTAATTADSAAPSTLLYLTGTVHPASAVETLAPGCYFGGGVELLAVNYGTRISICRVQTQAAPVPRHDEDDADAVLLVPRTAAAVPATNHAWEEMLELPKQSTLVVVVAAVPFFDPFANASPSAATRHALFVLDEREQYRLYSFEHPGNASAPIVPRLLAEGDLTDAFHLRSHHGAFLVAVHPRYPIVAVHTYERLVRIMNLCQLLCPPGALQQPATSGRKRPSRVAGQAAERDTIGPNQLVFDPAAVDPETGLPLIQGRVTIFSATIAEYAIDAIAFDVTPRSTRPVVTGAAHHHHHARGAAAAHARPPGAPPGVTTVPLATSAASESKSHHHVVDELTAGLDLYVLSIDRKKHRRALTSYAIGLDAAISVANAGGSLVLSTAVSTVTAATELKDFEPSATYLVALPRGVAVVGPHQVTFLQSAKAEAAHHSADRSPRPSSRGGAAKGRSSAGDAAASATGSSTLRHVATIAQPVAVGQNTVPQLVGVSAPVYSTATFVCAFEDGSLVHVAAPDDVAPGVPPRGFGTATGIATPIQIDTSATLQCRRSVASDVALLAEGQVLALGSTRSSSLVLHLQPDDSFNSVRCTRVVSATHNLGPVLSIAAAPLDSVPSLHEDARHHDGGSYSSSSLAGVIAGIGAGRNGRLCHIRGTTEVLELAIVPSTELAANIHAAGRGALALSYTTSSGTATQLLQVLVDDKGSDAAALSDAAEERQAPYEVTSVEMLDATLTGDDDPEHGVTLFVASLCRSTVTVAVTRRGVWVRHHPSGKQVVKRLDQAATCAAVDETADSIAVCHGRSASVFRVSASNGALELIHSVDVGSEGAAVAIAQPPLHASMDEGDRALLLYTAAWSDDGGRLFNLATNEEIAVEIQASTSLQPMRVTSALLDVHNANTLLAVLGTSDGRLAIATKDLSKPDEPLTVRRISALGVAPVYCIRMADGAAIARCEDGLAALVTWPLEHTAATSMSANDVLLGVRVVGLSLRGIIACAPLQPTTATTAPGLLVAFLLKAEDSAARPGDADDVKDSTTCPVNVVVGYISATSGSCSIATVPAGGSVTQLAPLPNLPFVATAIARSAGDVVVVAHVTGSRLSLEENPSVTFKVGETCTALLALEPFHINPHPHSGAYSSSAAGGLRSVATPASTNPAPVFMSPAVPPSGASFAAVNHWKGESRSVALLATASARLGADELRPVAGRVALYVYHPCSVANSSESTLPAATPGFVSARQLLSSGGATTGRPLYADPAAATSPTTGGPSVRHTSVRFKRVCEREVAQGAPYALCGAGTDRLLVAVNGTVELFRIRPAATMHDAMTPHDSGDILSRLQLELTPLYSLRVGVTICTLRRWTPPHSTGSLFLAGDAHSSFTALTLSSTDDSLEYFSKDVSSRLVMDGVCIGDQLVAADDRMNVFTLDLRNALKHPHLAVAPANAAGLPGPGTAATLRRMRPRDCVLRYGPEWHVGDRINCMVSGASVASGGETGKFAEVFLPPAPCQRAVIGGTASGAIVAIVPVSPNLFKLLFAVQTAISAQLSQEKPWNFDSHLETFASSPLLIRDAERSLAQGLHQLSTETTEATSLSTPTPLRRVTLPAEEGRAKGRIDGDLLQVYCSSGGLSDAGREAVARAATEALFGARQEGAEAATMSDVVHALATPQRDSVPKCITTMTLGELLAEVRRLY